MGHDMSEQQPAKTRKRQGVRASNRPAVKKVKSTIHLTVEASQRLDVHVAMMGPGTDRSSLIEHLINTHLRRYVVSDRGGPEGPTDEATAG